MYLDPDVFGCKPCSRKAVDSAFGCANWSPGFLMIADGLHSQLRRSREFLNLSEHEVSRILGISEMELYDLEHHSDE